MSSNLKLSLTNASERLRRYYKQGLLARRAVDGRSPRRRTMVYNLTETGRKRLPFLERTKFRRTEPDESEKYRTHQIMMKKMVMDLRQRLDSR